VACGDGPFVPASHSGGCGCRGFGCGTLNWVEGVAGSARPPVASALAAQPYWHLRGAEEQSVLAFALSSVEWAGCAFTDGVVDLRRAGCSRRPLCAPWPTLGAPERSHSFRGCIAATCSPAGIGQSLVSRSLGHRIVKVGRRAAYLRSGARCPAAPPEASGRRSLASRTNQFGNQIDGVGPRPIS
jgi:hypothetical protein